jgi:predicted O-linked N-acetylglucosamine transferase (SPINDLY family)
MRVLLTERFAKHGAPADRIDFLGSTTRMDHLLAYKDVDICLDPFPQNGGISTWEALHMGVPVVAKLGISIPGRLSGAIVSSIGLGEWVADSDEGYCAIAAKYASMPEHLATLRAALPGKIASSPAGNNAAYTKAVEAGYRAMWNDYIDGAAKKAVTSSQ